MKVYVQLQPHSRDWKPATVTECLEYKRYKVQLDFNGKEYIRNCIYIKPRTDEPRRSKRTIRKPNRYQDYQTWTMDTPVLIVRGRGDVVI